MWDSFFLQYLWEISLGICVADYLKEKYIRVNNVYLFVIAFVCVFVYGVLGFLGEPFMTFNDPFALGFMLAAALLIYQIDSAKKQIIRISAISYEWYLTHVLVAEIVFLFAQRYAARSIIVNLLVLVLTFVLWLFTAKMHLFVMNVLKKNLT